MDDQGSIPPLTSPQSDGSLAKPEPQVDVLVIRNHPGRHARTYSSASSLSSASDLNLSLPTSLLLNVSTLVSDDDAGSSAGSNSNTSTLTGGPSCDENSKGCNIKGQVTASSDINEPIKQTLRYAVIRKKSQDRNLPQQCDVKLNNTLGLTVHLVKGNMICHCLPIFSPKLGVFAFSRGAFCFLGPGVKFTHAKVKLHENYFAQNFFYHNIFFNLTIIDLLFWPSGDSPKNETNQKLTTVSINYLKT